MSTVDDNDEFDDFTSRAVGNDIISSGAAADSSATDVQLARLPRILRYAMLIRGSGSNIWQRLVAEIDELCPDMPLNAAWAITRDAGLTVALAVELDIRAVTQDRIELRGLADCVRLLGLPDPHDEAYIDDHRRVAKALLQAMQRLPVDTSGKLLADIEAFCFGWAALPVSTDLMPKKSPMSAAANAVALGRKMATHRIAATEASCRQKIEAVRGEALATARQEATGENDANMAGFSINDPGDSGGVVVAHIDQAQLKNSKLREIIGPVRSIINVRTPLVAVPPLQEIRAKLMFEFPHAGHVIDVVLADLVGRTTVKLRPLILVGPPGSGKSRFVRRLAEVLGLYVWRTDCGRAEGSPFAGTDRRWNTAEACHPLLAIGRSGHANPLVLLDELEKSATRSDYGRLWDCLLGFLEPETSARYPDPALQVTVNLSHVSYVAAVNSIEALPLPMRDRMRAITFPEPVSTDLDALLPAIFADLAVEHGLDRRANLPLDGMERAAVACHWHGGSIRRLRRIIETILRARDIHATRN